MHWFTNDSPESLIRSLQFVAAVGYTYDIAIGGKDVLFRAHSQQPVIIKKHPQRVATRH